MTLLTTEKNRFFVSYNHQIGKERFRMPTILEIQHLNKSFNKKTVLKDINLQIQSGTVVALVGANGAGKTTLINIILQLLPKDSGQVKFLTSHDWKTITGVMMQDNISLHRLKVKELINLSRSYFNHPLTYQQLLNLSGFNKSGK